MALVTQALARMDGDPLDLMVRPVGENFIEAPRPLIFPFVISWDQLHKLLCYHPLGAGPPPGCGDGCAT